ncbi:hypothetical protein [Stutzerimonas stutzeri]|uniref:hypothetical protein n=1 Tax=Stutzerimonas stutzeri TaxID=316 RepID=UPI00265D530F|nr:hypothetical protein [Stutzerimonas stutzeri]MCF6783721.1 hypothetical protein [Stutzerimonas stutzeri]
MATMLNETQRQRIADKARQASEISIPSQSELEPIKTEAELCRIFIEEFNKQSGWTSYPETAGFDVLVVHEDGRQIGVEAKLTLNAKVAEQILPKCGDEFYGAPGPDHRLVIVSKITEANAGIERMLQRLGVTVLTSSTEWTRTGKVHSFHLQHFLREENVSGRRWLAREVLFDWSPETRCQVPAVIPSLPAGVPSPVRLTPWKEAALRVIALMRSQGFITAKQIAAHGIGVTAWTQPTNKPAWLAKGASRGQWVETEHMPAFDKQHPDMYALAVAEAAQAQKDFELSSEH